MASMKHFVRIELAIQGQGVRYIFVGCPNSCVGIIIKETDSAGKVRILDEAVCI